MLDFEVDSLSGFLKAWLAATLLIVGYAWVDLHANPHLAFETSFTLTPDASRLSDLLDWGGRLARSVERVSRQDLVAGRCAGERRG